MQIVAVLMGKDGGDEEVLREKYVKKGCHVPDKKNKKVDGKQIVLKNAK